MPVGASISFSVKWDWFAGQILGPTPLCILPATVVTMWMLTTAHYNYYTQCLQLNFWHFQLPVVSHGWKVLYAIRYFERPQSLVGSTAYHSMLLQRFYFVVAVATSLHLIYRLHFSIDYILISTRDFSGTSSLHESTVW